MIKPLRCVKVKKGKYFMSYHDFFYVKANISNYYNNLLNANVITKKTKNLVIFKFKNYVYF